MSLDLPDGQMAHARHAKIARRVILSQVGALASSGKSVALVRAIPRPPRGAFLDRHERWLRDAMVRHQLTSDVLADGKIVWSCPPDAGVKFCETFRRATVATKPGSPGRARDKP
jgi:hypothetical protein